MRAGLRKRAVGAVARKLAVIMHCKWIDGSRFQFSAANTQPEDHAAAGMVAA